MYSKNIIVIAAGINGLGAVRSAHRAGLNVIAVIFDENGLAAMSRYIKEKFLLPRSVGGSPLLAVLKEIKGKYGKCSVITCSDRGAELVAEHYDELSRYHYCIPVSAKTVGLLNDKMQECAILSDYCSSLPKTYFELARDEPKTFPILVKPRTHLEYDLLRAKNRLIHDEEQLKAFRLEFPSDLDRFIAQEVIEGPDSALWVCNVTFDSDYKLVSFFSFRRLGTTPSHFGVTSFAVSEFNQALLDECEQIGRALEYTGPAMIEFKRCAKTGKYYYIETNPRLGMCNWYDTRCGVNNVYAAHRVVQGQPVTWSKQRDGVVFLNLTGDLIARAEDRENPLTVMKLYLSYLFHPVVGATFYWKDPLPGLIYSWSNMKLFISRALKLVMKR